MIKCIVCDMDGTLIKDDDTVEEKTIQTIRSCMEKGIEFMVATGRDISMVKNFLDMYDIKCDLILNNGAQYVNKERTVNQLYPMDNHSFKKIADILQEYGYLIVIHTDQGKYSFFNEDDFWAYHMELIKGLYGDNIPQKTFTTREGYLCDFHYVTQAQDIIDKGIHVLKIDARHTDIEVVKGIKKQLNIDGLDISSSFEDNMEITSHQSNKGILLDDVMKQKGYALDEVAVFGDGENDIHMLERFTYSFAPKNACAKAKNSARYQLTKDNLQGAVFEGIEILKKEGLIR